MLIRLIKEWNSGVKTYPAGQLLEIPAEKAKSLIENAVAEIYEPQQSDVVAESTVKNEAQYSLTEDLIRLIDEKIKEQIQNYARKNSSFHQASESSDYEKTGGFKSIGHLAHEVYRASVSRSMPETLGKWTNYLNTKASGMQESVGSDGGYLVPTAYRSELMRVAVENSVLLGRVTRIPMETNSVKIPTIDETSRAASVYGGIVVYRPTEGGTITGSKPKIGSVQLNLNKLAAMAYVSSELLEDSPISIEPLFATTFGEAIGFQIDEDIINGTGVGQPLGILNSPSLISVAKETGQAAATIVAENILKMWSRMLPACQKNAIWIANNDTFEQLASLSLPVGTGGIPAGLLQMSTNGLTGTPQQTLINKPLFLTEHAQTLGTVGDIICIDPTQYLFGEKAGGAIQAATSIHIKFVEDEVAFRFTLRYDGQPWMKSAITPKHGSNTLSAFVALATRS